MSVSVDFRVNVTNGSITDQVKDNLNQVNQAFTNKEVAFDLFNNNLIFLKGFGLLFLVCMAFVNYEIHGKKTGPITQEPWRFFIESLVFGLCGLIPVLVLYYLRNNGSVSMSTVVKWCVTLFGIFFLLNYLLELCGFYAVVFDYNPNETPAPENDREVAYSAEFKQSFSYTATFFMTLLFIYCFIVMILAVVIVRDMQPNFTRFTGAPPIAVFFVEMLIFGAISAVPIYLMAYNRDRLSFDTTIEFLVIMAKFSLLHVVLQLSGFYNYLFRNEKPK